MNAETATPEADSGSAQVQEQAPQAEITTAAQKAKKSGNVILDVAAEVEGLTKVKALNLADKLVDSIETDYFRLGGVLKVIHENAWFEGHESFSAFVSDKFGFQERKAKYLMEIYDHLVTKMIPWETVAPLGWTKLKDLARHLTVENVDGWVEKAMKLTVTELQAVLKDQEGGEGKAKSVEGSGDVVKFKVNLKTDQNDTVQSALSKAKAEVGTEFDSVALEMICTGYLAGSVGTGAPKTLAEQMKEAGWKAALTAFGEQFPDVDLEVTKVPE